MYSSINSHLISAETKRQHHPKDYRDIQQMLSPYPLILCQIIRLNGMKRLGVNALYRRAPRVESSKLSCEIQKKRTGCAKFALNPVASKRVSEISS